MKEGRRQGRQRKRWEDNIGEWAGLEFAKSKRAVENSEKNDKTDCKIICGASTTLVVKELMMMMMMMIMMVISVMSQQNETCVFVVPCEALYYIGLSFDTAHS